jgi:hypothetical protein
MDNEILFLEIFIKNIFMQEDEVENTNCNSDENFF